MDTPHSTTPYNEQGTPKLEKLRPSDSSMISHTGNMSMLEGSRLSLIKEGSRRVLGTISIAGLCYFSVSGGPVGSEYVISSGGPLIGFIMMLLFPLLWGAPIAFVTAELSTAYPDDGGYTLWILKAFGPFWAFQTGYWSWVSGVTDNAIYPALAVSTFTDAWGSFGSGFEDYLVAAALAILMTLPNLFGVRIVGNGMAILSVFVMVPFVVLCMWGIANSGSWSVFGEVRRSDIEYDADGNFVSMSGSVDIDWSNLINTLFWNYNGASGMSVFGGEVHNPGRTYPRAMWISLILIAFTYLVPLFGATAHDSPHWTTWEDGSFSSIAQSIGGNFLLNWVVVATFASNIGMFVAELFVDSFQLLGMAECGLAPKVLAHRNKRFDTPHNSIMCSLVLILFLIHFQFDDILTMTNALSAFYQLLIFAAFIKLRITQPDLERPYKIPGPLWLICLWLIVPVALLVYIGVDVFFTLAPGILVAVFTVIGVAWAWYNKFTVEQFEQYEHMQARMTDA